MSPGSVLLPFVLLPRVFAAVLVLVLVLVYFELLSPVLMSSVFGPNVYAGTLFCSGSSDLLRATVRHLSHVSIFDTHAAFTMQYRTTESDAVMSSPFGLELLSLRFHHFSA